MADINKDIKKGQLSPPALNLTSITNYHDDYEEEPGLIGSESKRAIKYKQAQLKQRLNPSNVLSE